MEKDRKTDRKTVLHVYTNTRFTPLLQKESVQKKLRLEINILAKIEPLIAFS